MQQAKLISKRMMDGRWVMGLVFLLMLLASWRRWASVIADSGREMDLPRRLLEGEWLYRDVHYLYPPLSPYFNALLYRIFGLHLDVLHVSGVICSVIVVVLCSRIARRLLPPQAAAAAVIAIIVWCIFRPSGNLIAPYAFAALHGMILALGALLFTLRYARRRERRDLLAAGALVGLAAITKQEFALTAGVTLVATLVYLHRANLKQLAVSLSLAALPAAAIALPIYGWLLYRVGWQTLAEDCHLFYTHLPASLVFYNAQRTGLDRPLRSILQMLGGAAVCLAIVSALRALTVLSAEKNLSLLWKPGVSLSQEARRMLTSSGIFFALSLVYALIIHALTSNLWDGSPLRALPLLLIGVIVSQWRRAAKSKDRASAAGASPSLFIIAVYSLVILVRVALRVPSGGAFGSFFLPTSWILIYYWLIVAVPQAIGGRGQNLLFIKRARLIGHVLLGATVLATAVIFAVRYRSNFNFEVIAPRGHLFATRPVGQAVSEALDFIATHTAPGEAVAVLPEGSDLTFLSGRRMPLRHQILIPGLMSERDEREAIARLESLRVHYVLIVNRPMREFGAEAFGLDYYQTLGQWIDEHYDLRQVCGPKDRARLEIGDPAFFIKVFARRD